MDSFETFPEQAEAKRLLRAAVREGPAHAYLFHGPAGVGKRAAARALATELLGDALRVEHGTHPDLYLVEPLGDQIRIDEIRALRHDLHMRPFEADRRVYLLFAAHLMNEDASDALLKDLEEPPPYAVMVLVADEIGPLPETIRSRCQLIPFRRLSQRAVRESIAARAPGLPAEQVAALARVAAGRLDRAERLLDAEASRRREALLEVARATYSDPEFEPADAAKRLLEGAAECGQSAREDAERELETLDLPTREAEQRVRRAQRGAEREELLASLEELAGWYRDLVVVAVGAERAVLHSDRLTELAEDGTRERLVAAERAAATVRDTWRTFEEFNVSPALALEALFVRVRRSSPGRPLLREARQGLQAEPKWPRVVRAAFPEVAQPAAQEETLAPAVLVADRAVAPALDPEAGLMHELYRRYADQILGFCLHRLGSREEAEDATQSTFLNAFRSLQSGVEPQSESAWLFKIAENACLSRQRASYRRGRVEAASDFEHIQDTVPSREPDPDELIPLAGALAQMLESQRHAILLREWKGLSYREISDEMALSEGAVEMLVYRARRSLARGLTRRDG